MSAIFLQHVDSKTQISVQTWMSKQDDDFSRKHLFTISSIAVNDAFLCIVFCQRCSNRCTGTCISYRLCVSITNHVPFHCSMNVLKSVLVFVSFLVTVDARTLLSQNKPGYSGRLCTTINMCNILQILRLESKTSLEFLTLVRLNVS